VYELDRHTDRVRLIQLAMEGLPALVIDCFSFLPDGIVIIRDILEGSNIKVF